MRNDRRFHLSRAIDTFPSSALPRACRTRRPSAAIAGPPSHSGSCPPIAASSVLVYIIPSRSSTRAVLVTHGRHRPCRPASRFRSIARRAQDDSPSSRSPSRMAHVHPRQSSFNAAQSRMPRIGLLPCPIARSVDPRSGAQISLPLGNRSSRSHEQPLSEPEPLDFVKQRSQSGGSAACSSGSEVCRQPPAPFPGKDWVGVNV